MSYPEAPATTEAQQILDTLDLHRQRLEALTEAINGLGANVQWIIDNVKGIFEMFNNPQFMSMMPGMMGGVPDGGGKPE